MPGDGVIELKIANRYLTIKYRPIIRPARLLAADDDDIVTGDPADIERLAQLAGRHVEIVRI
jgi:hypothetical protein